MATTEKTPLWMEIKKEYIDDSFNKLQAYLRECSEKTDKEENNEELTSEEENKLREIVG